MITPTNGIVRTRQILNKIQYPVSYYLVHVVYIWTDKPLLLKLAAYSRKDALRIAEYLGKARIVDEIQKPLETDNHRILDMASGYY